MNKQEYIKKKKEYSKPDISFQNFRLSTELCASCMYQADFAANACPVIVAGFPFVLITDDNCEMSAPEVTDTICYHVPITDSNIFGGS